MLRIIDLRFNIIGCYGVVLHCLRFPFRNSVHVFSWAISPICCSKYSYCCFFLFLLLIFVVFPPVVTLPLLQLVFLCSFWNSLQSIVLIYQCNPQCLQVLFQLLFDNLCYLSDIRSLSTLFLSFDHFFEFQPSLF